MHHNVPQTEDGASVSSFELSDSEAGLVSSWSSSSSRAIEVSQAKPKPKKKNAH